MARSLGVSLLRRRCNMANMKDVSQSHSGAALESNGALNSSDDGFDFPPTLHPVRELVTFSIFASGIIALIVWGGSKLF